MSITRLKNPGLRVLSYCTEYRGIQSTESGVKGLVRNEGVPRILQDDNFISPVTVPFVIIRSSIFGIAHHSLMRSCIENLKIIIFQ